MSEERETPGVAPAASRVSEADRMRGERIRACVDEINAVLEKHKCRLLAVVVIVGGQVQERVEVVSL